MVLAGCATVIFDYKVFHGPVAWIVGWARRKKRTDGQEIVVEMGSLPPQRQDGEGVDGVDDSVRRIAEPVAAPQPVHTRSSSEEDRVSGLPTSRPDGAED